MYTALIFGFLLYRDLSATRLTTVNASVLEGLPSLQRLCVIELYIMCNNLYCIVLSCIWHILDKSYCHKSKPELLQHGKNGKSYQECCVTEECPLVLKEKYIDQW